MKHSDLTMWPCLLPYGCHGFLTTHTLSAFNKANILDGKWSSLKEYRLVHCFNTKSDFSGDVEVNSRSQYEVLMHFFNRFAQGEKSYSAHVLVHGILYVAYVVFFPQMYVYVWIMEQQGSYYRSIYFARTIATTYRHIITLVYCCLKNPQMIAIEICYLQWQHEYILFSSTL